MLFQFLVIFAYLVIPVIITLRLLLLLYFAHHGTTKQKHFYAEKRSVKTMVVLGIGDSPSESLPMFETIQSAKYTPVILCKPTSYSFMDHLPVPKDKTTVQDFLPSSIDGQATLSTAIMTLKVHMYAFQLVLSTRPELLMCRYSELQSPICLAVVVLRFLCVTPTEVLCFRKPHESSPPGMIPKLLTPFVYRTDCKAGEQRCFQDAEIHEMVSNPKYDALRFAVMRGCCDHGYSTVQLNGSDPYKRLMNELV